MLKVIYNHVNTCISASFYHFSTNFVNTESKYYHRPNTLCGLRRVVFSFTLFSWLHEEWFDCARFPIRLLSAFLRKGWEVLFMLNISRSPCRQSLWMLMSFTILFLRQHNLLLSTILWLVANRTVAFPRWVAVKPTSGFTQQVRLIHMELVAAFSVHLDLYKI